MGQTRPVVAGYLVAEDIIDQYLQEVIERKRELPGRLNDGNVAPRRALIRQYWA
jgi:hypothetical protein